MKWPRFNCKHPSIHNNNNNKRTWEKISAPMCEASFSSSRWCRHHRRRHGRRREYVISVACFSCHLRLFRVVYSLVLYCCCCLSSFRPTNRKRVRIQHRMWYVNYFETIEIVVRIFKFIITILFGFFCVCSPQHQSFSLARVQPLKTSSISIQSENSKNKNETRNDRMKIENMKRVNCKYNCFNVHRTQSSSQWMLSRIAMHFNPDDKWQTSSVFATPFMRRSAQSGRRVDLFVGIRPKMETETCSAQR